GCLETYVQFGVVKVWPERKNMGENKLGDVISKQIGDKTLHAIICYSVYENALSWSSTIVEQCLENLDLPADEKIAIIWMKNGEGEFANEEGYFEPMEPVARSKCEFITYRQR